MKALRGEEGEAIIDRFNLYVDFAAAVARADGDSSAVFGTHASARKAAVAAAPASPSDFDDLEAQRIRKCAKIAAAEAAKLAADAAAVAGAGVDGPTVP